MPSSPCIKECNLLQNVCTGCGRTKEHIINWIRYTEEERLQIMQQLSRHEEQLRCETRTQIQQSSNTYQSQEGE
jgi:predicted Fe-S protein YdhL (DUF1289 family)